MRTLMGVAVFGLLCCVSLKAESATAFERIRALYAKGEPAEISDFDPARALLGRVVYFRQPDTLLDCQLISLESGDAVVGTVRRAAAFKILKPDNSPGVIADGQAVLERLLLPLRFDSASNAILSTSVADDYYCVTKDYWRRVTGEDGKKTLVRVSFVNDPRSFCSSARASVPPEGEMLRVAYFQLP